MQMQNKKYKRLLHWKTFARGYAAWSTETHVTVTVRRLTELLTAALANKLGKGDQAGAPSKQIHAYKIRHPLYRLPILG